MVTVAKSAIFLLPGDHIAITTKIGTVEGGNMKFKLNGDRLNALNSALTNF